MISIPNYVSLIAIDYGLVLMGVSFFKLLRVIKRRFYEKDTMIRQFRCDCGFVTFSSEKALMHKIEYSPHNLHKIKEVMTLVRLHRRRKLGHRFILFLRNEKSAKGKSSLEEPLIENTKGKRRIDVGLRAYITKRLLTTSLLLLGSEIGIYYFLRIFSSPPLVMFTVMPLPIVTYAYAFFFARWTWNFDHKRHLASVKVVGLFFSSELETQSISIIQYTVGLDYWEKVDKPALSGIPTPYGDYYILEKMIFNKWGELIRVQ